MANEETKLTAKTKWTFDNYSRGESEVVLLDSDVDETRIAVRVEGVDKMRLELYRDQWGTYLSFWVGGEEFTIAQEDGTRSFLDAFLAAIAECRPWIDVKTKPATKQVLEDKSDGH